MINVIVSVRVIVGVNAVRNSGMGGIMVPGDANGFVGLVWVQIPSHSITMRGHLMGTESHRDTPPQI